MSFAESHASFQRELVEAGALVPSAVEGLYGRSGAFEDIIEAVDRLVVAAGSDLKPESFRFPPVLPMEVFEKTDYLASFPNLTGAISTFTGDDRAHAELLALHADRGDWFGKLDPAGVMLVSAACHPAYPMMSGQLPEGGSILDVLGYCFRHEPAIDPMRMQVFRQHEFVYLGDPDGARAHRDMWVTRGLELLESLGLEATSDIANDPFFGRAGRMLASNQRSEILKIELVVHMYGGPTEGDRGTAVVSCNCHLDHFGSSFGIKTADSEVAHTACVGFGMERIALALLRTHGMKSDRWPDSVKRRLWP